MMGRPTTLRGRLTLWYSGILTAMLALLSATSVILLDRALRNNVDDSLSSVARAIAESVRRPTFFGPDIEETLQSMLGPELAERFFQLLDRYGQPDPRLVPPRRSKLPLSAEALRNAERGQATFETVGLRATSEKSMRLLTWPVVRNNATVNIVQVAMSLQNVEATRSRFLLILLILAPVALAGSVLGGWFLAHRALNPVDAIVETALRIEAEDLTQRVPRSSDDELGRLAAVLNDMLARLERSFGAVRRFSADAAHELRTPLTILKGEIEVALRSSQAPAEIQRTLVSCLEEVDRLNSLVDDLLLMARMEGNALSARPSRVNLADVLEDAAPALNELATRAGNICRVAATPPLWMEGYESLLFRLVFNLAENAIKYTPKGGSVEVTLERQNSSAVLQVRDNGPGIAPDAQEHIFDRFYRGDPAREGSGTGLGLALVRAIVELHQGQIRVSSAPGKGSCFRVTLPLAPGPSSSQSED
jgi:two-component system OmpR family sensor kinase